MPASDSATPCEALRRGCRGNSPFLILSSLVVPAGTGVLLCSSLEEIGLVHVGVRLKWSLREPGTSGFESAIHFDLLVFVNDAALLVVKIEGETLDQIVRACELASVNVLSFATSAKRTYHLLHVLSTYSRP